MATIFERLFQKVHRTDDDTPGGSELLSGDAILAACDALRAQGDMGRLVASLLQNCDMDGNGSVSRQEFQTYFGMLNYPDAVMQSFAEVVGKLPAGEVSTSQIGGQLATKEAELPPGWEKVPSESRPGQFSYLNRSLNIKVTTLEHAWSYRGPPAVGQNDLEYYSISMGRWLPCSVVNTRSDGAVEVSVKPGYWISKAEAHSKLRKQRAQRRQELERQDVEADELPAPQLSEQRSGFLVGKEEDKVASVEEAKAKVLGDPRRYMGYTVGYGSLIYVRRYGSKFVKMPNWTSHLVACKGIDYDGPLFRDRYCDDKTRFQYGLENGKTQQFTAAWRRPGRGQGLCDGRPIKLFGSIEPNDLKQGEVGNCSLIAAIAAVAEYPGAIRRLFGGRTRLSRRGEYHVTLWDWGTRDWRDFHIDDRFACSSEEDPDVKFAKCSEDGEIYPMLIEKAVAIMAKGFEFCNQIMPTWALGVLTGCPDCFQFERDAASGTWIGFRSEYDGTSTYKSSSSYENVWPDGSSGQTTRTDAEMWQVLCSFDQSHYMMCCGKTGELGVSDAVTTDSGIHYVHAYSLIQLKSDIAGTGVSLAQCRNPHGLGGREPTLPWHDGDERWARHPEVRQACEWSEDKWIDDGLFWMSREDFFGTWTTVYMVKCNMDESSKIRIAIPSHSG
eukprot:TRINITY_DN71928_c0_g1_i1.p1 TRINITY_DN71928_c0_g1~~TRINITY_DN71928_c0_g1_i1.p1  ORF type:complete len:668 (+),score=149.34 TRINITY_DN71928_c0_g1_i1:41-2044(+)